MGVMPSDVLIFLKPFSEMKDKDPELMTAYQGKASKMPGFRRITSFSEKELEKGHTMLNALNSKPWTNRISMHHNSKLQLVSNFKSDTLAPLGAECPEPIVLTLMIRSQLFTADPGLGRYWHCEQAECGAFRAAPQVLGAPRGMDCLRHAAPLLHLVGELPLPKFRG